MRRISSKIIRSRGEAMSEPSGTINAVVPNTAKLINNKYLRRGGYKTYSTL